MAIDNTPWFPGYSGARVSAHVARTLSYLAAGGEEGVANPGDMRVTPTGTPGGSVIVTSGAVSVLVRAPGHAHQTFVARNASSTTVPVAATSGAARSDLVCAIMRDPSVPGSGGTTPADPIVGPYWELTVVSGVPAGTTKLQQVAGYSGISGYALARIDRPASTGVVTADHIKDLRDLVLARQRREVASIPQGGNTAAGTRHNPLTSSTAFVLWPPTAKKDVEVPIWATHALILVTISQFTLKSGNSNGQLKVTMSGKETPISSFDENYTGSPHRGSVTIAGEIEIPVESRGTPDLLRVMGKRTSWAADGALDADGFTSTIIDVQFVERI